MYGNTSVKVKYTTHPRSHIIGKPNLQEKARQCKRKQKPGRARNLWGSKIYDNRRNSINHSKIKVDSFCGEARYTKTTRKAQENHNKMNVDRFLWGSKI